MFAKSSYYRTIDSLAEHLLVAQDEIRVEQYIKQTNGEWSLFEYLTLDINVHLPSIDCSLQLNRVYDRISLEPNRRVSGQ
jgi:hypothetical protein